MDDHTPRKGTAQRLAAKRDALVIKVNKMNNGFAIKRNVSSGLYATCVHAIGLTNSSYLEYSTSQMQMRAPCSPPFHGKSGVKASP